MELIGGLPQQSGDFGFCRKLSQKAPPLSPPNQTARQMQLSLIVPLGGPKPSSPQNLAWDKGSPECERLVTAEAEVPPGIIREWEDRGFQVFFRRGSRGEGLKEMAERAKSPLLLFVHGDTQLPRDGLSQILEARAAGHHWGAFHLGFDRGMGVPHRLGLALVAWGANLRSRRGLPFGDQAPFFDKEFYFSLGGHPSFDLMEDYVLSKRAARVEAPALLHGRVRTSARRYLAQGILRTVLQNRRIIKAFKKKVSPEELARIYYR